MSITSDHYDREQIAILEQLLVQAKLQTVFLRESASLDKVIFAILRETEDDVDEILRELHRMAHLLAEIRDNTRTPLPIGFIVTQGASMPVTGTITGLFPGQTDNFFATPVDANGNSDVLPSGTPVPSITSSDPAVTLVPAADGLSAAVTAPAAAVVGGSFTLTWSTMLAGASAPITGVATVPYIQAPAQAPVGFVIGQGAPPA